MFPLHGSSVAWPQHQGLIVLSMWNQQQVHHMHAHYMSLLATIARWPVCVAQVLLYLGAVLLLHKSRWCSWHM